MLGNESEQDGDTQIRQCPEQVIGRDQPDLFIADELLRANDDGQRIEGPCKHEHEDQQGFGKADPYTGGLPVEDAARLGALREAAIPDQGIQRVCSLFRFGFDNARFELWNADPDDQGGQNEGEQEARHHEAPIDDISHGCLPCALPGRSEWRSARPRCQ